MRTRGGVIRSAAGIIACSGVLIAFCLFSLQPSAFTLTDLPRKFQTGHGQPAPGAGSPIGLNTNKDQAGAPASQTPQASKSPACPCPFDILVAQMASRPLGPAAVTGDPTPWVLSFLSEPPPGEKGPRRIFRGIASWYGPRFQGRLTASGETYNMYRHTAAHRTFPFGTMIRVTNLRNGRHTVVRINDRGPYVKGREVDLSYRAAQDLQMVKTGIVPVRLEILPARQSSSSLVN